VKQKRQAVIRERGKAARHRLKLTVKSKRGLLERKKPEWEITQNTSPGGGGGGGGGGGRGKGVDG